MTDLEYLLDSKPEDGTIGDIERATNPWWTSKAKYLDSPSNQWNTNILYYLGKQWKWGETKHVIKAK